MSVQLRFAPSPTGELHVGGLRTALFSYLYAKKHQGKIFFRLEDTDRTRFVEGAEQNLLNALNRAGICFDDAVTRQSERLAIYQQHVQILLESRHAYRCFCSPKRLESLRQRQKEQGLPTAYDGTCRHLSRSEITKKQHLPFVVRLALPQIPETLQLQDVIRGNLTFNTADLEDQILIKADGFPTYHLAMVVDDHLMGITHVVRGEEWLPSYPKHALLFRYFQWQMPEFVHLPLILNEDRSKLSKRTGSASVEGFYSQGYLPQALINFLALLGWSAGDEREFFSIDELIEEFSWQRVSKSGAVFDKHKLDWMNQHYLQRLDKEEFEAYILPFVQQTQYANEPDVMKVCQLFQSRLKTGSDIQHRLASFFEDDFPQHAPKMLELLQRPTTKQMLSLLIEQLTELAPYSGEAFSKLAKQVQKTTQIKGQEFWLPLRYALTFEEHGPDLKAIAEIFGKEKCLSRLKKSLSV